MNVKVLVFKAAGLFPMWIKICGIRDLNTARTVADLEIDAIGLNFHPRSPRAVDIETAAKISKILPAAIARVGVFVNHSIDEVEQIADRCHLDFLQLHGDESPSYMIELKQRLPQLRLIRASRMDQSGLSSLRAYLAECRDAMCELAGCLIDAHVPGVYGGSGKVVPWEQLQREYDREGWPPLILAGGLKPSNIAAAITAVQPWGVDVASGVESSPGNKELALVQQFVQAARQVPSEKRH